MARLASKIAVGLALLSALALSATAQVAVVDPEDRLPHYNDNNQLMNLNAGQRNTTLHNPGISITAFVSDKTAYYDANRVTGPWLSNRTNTESGLVKFKLRVRNTGAITLRNIVVKLRNLAGVVIRTLPTISELKVDDKKNLYVRLPFAFNQQGIRAEVRASSSRGSVSASNPAHYYGVRPRIWLSKSVLSDGQWLPANKATDAVNVTTDPVFLFVVRNTGNVGLSNVVVRDAQLGDISIGSLGVGKSRTFNRTGIFVAGLSNNTAQARGTWKTERVFASDAAWTYGGVSPPPGNPSLTIVKGAINATSGNSDYVDANTEEGAALVPVGGTPTYGFIVINSGDVDLTDVIIVDPLLGERLEFSIGSLPAGENVTVLGIEGEILVDAVVGTVVNNTAYATGSYGSAPVTSNQDFALVVVVAAEAEPNPGLTFLKQILYNGVLYDAETLDEAVTILQPLDGKVTYVFNVTNVGDVQLNDIVITDPDLTDNMGNDQVHTFGNLEPGQSDSWVEEADWQEGEIINTATVTAKYKGDIVVEETNSAVYIGTQPGVTSPPR